MKTEIFPSPQPKTSQWNYCEAKHEVIKTEATRREYFNLNELTEMKFGIQSRDFT